MAQLVYETTDPDFADRALAAMHKHGIPSYRVGHGYSNKMAEFGPFGSAQSESQICLYIERDKDYVAANRVLIALGAVVEKPIPLWRVVAFAVIVVAASIWLVLKMDM